MFNLGPSLSTRVVATAYGVCGSFGTGHDALTACLESHDAPSDGAFNPVDDDALDTALAGLLASAEQRRMDRLTKFGTYAGLACFRDSGITITAENRDQLGGIFSCSFGPVSSTREFMRSGVRSGIKGASPLLFPYTVYNACPGVLTILLGIRGANSTVSGLNPVAYAVDLLREGRACALLAGGFEEMTPEIVRALGEPMLVDGDAEPIAPLGEGAAIVMLETYEHAHARGAMPLFEIRGLGQSVNLDARVTAVDNMREIEPAAIARAMRDALADAALRAKDVEMVVSLSRRDHGQTESELEAIAGVWDGCCHMPEMRYPKHRLGETFGCSDTLALIAASVYAAPVTSGVRHVMVNSYQLGGNVSSLIVELS